jgi:hypothetical protein
VAFRFQRHKRSARSPRRQRRAASFRARSKRSISDRTISGDPWPIGVRLASPVWTGAGSDDLRSRAARPAGDERRGGDSCLGCDRRRARAGARRGPGRSPASCFGMSRVSVSFRRAAAVEGRPRAALESQPATTTGSKLASCGPHSAWRDATMAYASQFRYSDRRRSPAFTPERLRRFHHVKSAAAAPVAARSPRRNQVGI